jgi:hypothetical protein
MPLHAAGRTLFLAGLAAVLICGALSWRQLGGSRRKAATFTEVSREAAARVLRETEELRTRGGDLFVHSHPQEEPCGEACSKDHAHTHTLPARTPAPLAWLHAWGVPCQRLLPGPQVAGLVHC